MVDVERLLPGGPPTTDAAPTVLSLQEGFVVMQFEAEALSQMPVPSVLITVPERGAINRTSNGDCGRSLYYVQSLHVLRRRTGAHATASGGGRSR
jgi:hypothetical protein